jgi:hypothetical protein
LTAKYELALATVDSVAEAAVALIRMGSVFLRWIFLEIPSGAP